MTSIVKQRLLLGVFMSVSILQGLCQVAINNDNTLPNSSAMLDVKSTNKGVLIPRMTVEQRTLITSPAEGLVVFCTNCGYNGSGVLTLYSNGSWKNLNPCKLSAPVSVQASSSITSVTWNWSAVPGAYGYKWNTVNNYTTATDVGAVNKYTETGITCGSALTRYVWAYNECTVSGFLTLTYTPSCSWSCGQSFTDSRNGKTYGSVLIGSQCWMNENLNYGSDVSYTFTQENDGLIERYCYEDLFEDVGYIFGGLYQWDEMMNYTASSAANPSGRPGICPSGWHVPSYAEWLQMSDFLGGYMVSGGKLKTAGYMMWQPPNTGATNSSGFNGLPGGATWTDVTCTNLSYSGIFWTATEYDATSANVIWLDNDYVELTSGPLEKGNGFSVRCVKD